jgi:DNA polymerase-3 subunit gamma/tau
MGKALYRKYRPTSFAEAVGQQHITKTLEQAIKTGKISHAYLFTGPRGVGKTSVARILAHEVNGLPYKDDSIHLDIIEIDAASNRRIDEIRELRDKVHITPTSAKYKVYIIDEVHMLTREAFNALLKTLEEPPAHCIFILATTEVHKLPETIISRTQRFSFKPVSKDPAAKYLGEIAKKEKINITEGALELLAEHGQGSFRDSISLLDQLSTHKGKITEDTVRELVGLPSGSAIIDLVDDIKNGQQTSLLEKLDALSTQGTSSAQIAKELGKEIRKELVNGTSEAWIPELLRHLIEVPASPSPLESLEIALLEAASKNSSKATSSKSDPVEISLPNVQKESKANIEPAKVVTKSQKIEDAVESIEEEYSTNFDIKSWPQVVEYTKTHNASLHTALRLAKPQFAGGILTLCFQFPLHQKKVNQAMQKALIGKIIEQLTKSRVKIDCIVDKSKFKKADPVPENKKEIAEEAPNSLKTISSIFGNAEMVES